MAILSIELCGMKLKNPLILASGVCDVTKQSMERVAKDGAGAVTTKSITPEPRAGHPTPIIAQTECGFLNAVGYANPGIEDALKEFSGWGIRAPLIFSITGKNAGEFSALTEKITQSNIHIDAIEAAISCPHTPGYGTLAGQSTPEAAAEITKAIKDKANVPVIIKLSPNVQALGEIAKAAESSGASAINMGNTHGPGMVIDIERKKPVLSFGFGGLSGPAIKPIAVRCVHDLYKSVKIPIIGTGGVTTGKDAIEMMMAGASSVGVGTAVYYKGTKVFKKIANEMKKWLETHGYANTSEIIGVAHEKSN